MEVIKAPLQHHYTKLYKGSEAAGLSNSPNFALLQYFYIVGVSLSEPHTRTALRMYVCIYAC